MTTTVIKRKVADDNKPKFIIRLLSGLYSFSKGLLWFLIGVATAVIGMGILLNMGLL